jgi:electron transfer flavoprotein alpha subunit
VTFNRLFNFQTRLQSTLVIAEHDNAILTPITQSSITAAKKIGNDVTVLVAGTKVSEVASAVAKLDGVKKILVAESDAFNGFLPESLTPLVLAAQKQFNFTHIIAGATAKGKSLVPRIASKLDVSPISEVIAIKDADTFVRTIYAGNAILTLKSLDSVKVLTVRGTNFEACGSGSSEAATEQAPAGEYKTDLAAFVKQDLAKSDRPELTAAKCIVSGNKNSLNF